MNKTLILSALLLALGAGGGYWAAKQTTDGASAEEKTPLLGQPMDPATNATAPPRTTWGWTSSPSMRSKRAARRAPSPSAPRSSRTWGAARQGRATPIHQQVETVGYVGYDEDKLEAVNARMAGWIRTLAIKSEGQQVSKGASSTSSTPLDLVNAQHEYLLALNTTNPLLLRAAEGKLKSLQVPADQIAALKRTRQVQETVRIYAPSSGYVSELKVREGQYVEPAAASSTSAPSSRCG